MSEEPYTGDELQGILEKVNRLSLDSAVISNELAEIKKELQEWRYL